MNALVVAGISLSANAVTIIGGVISLLILTRRNGINDGRQIEILSNLQSLASDHETRIRVLETKTK